jgi:hypothetical protein
MVSYSLRDVPEELWLLVVATIPRNLNIQEGLQRLFEWRILEYYDDEEQIKREFRGTLDEDDPSLEELLEYYRELAGEEE